MPANWTPKLKAFISSIAAMCTRWLENYKRQHTYPPGAPDEIDLPMAIGILLCVIAIASTIH